MWQFFADNPWVAVFAVITVGALLGMVRFGPVKLGAAGVLFVGLLVGALDKDIAPAVAGRGVGPGPRPVRVHRRPGVRARVLP